MSSSPPRKNFERMARRRNERARAVAPLLAYGGLTPVVTAAEVQARWEQGEREAAAGWLAHERAMTRRTVVMRRLVRQLDVSAYFHLKVLWPRTGCPKSYEYRADYWHQALTAVAAAVFDVPGDTRVRT